jgi:hypothetical protein
MPKFSKDYDFQKYKKLHTWSVCIDLELLNTKF